MVTERARAKEQRRKELLKAAAVIIADKGFHQTRLGDVGAAVGISGPGVYRHFDSKDDLLAELLLNISLRLVDGAREVMSEHHQEDGSLDDPEAVLNEFVMKHVEFAATESELIRIQEREIRNLESTEFEKVRSLQRMYLRLWTDVLLKCRPDLQRSEARIRVQFAAGLINSSRHVIHWAGEDLVRSHAGKMAVAAMLVE